MTRLVLRTPLILCNFKTYEEATGERAFKLAETAELVSIDSKVQILVAPQYTDIPRITSRLRIPVFAQHVDYHEPGMHTGFVLPEALVASGCRGTMLNHAERPVGRGDIKKTIDRCGALDLVTCVLSNGVDESTSISVMRPEMMVVELPELIGTGRAISTVNPEVITNAIAAVRSKNEEVLLIAGSGISNRGDVLRAIELGMQGVGSSKAVVLSKQPRDVLEEMANALHEGMDRVEENKS